MRTVAAAFWIANALLVSAGAWLAWAKLRPAGAAAVPATRTATPTAKPSAALVTAAVFRPRELTQATPLGGGEASPAHLLFCVAAGERFVGVGGLRAYPITDDGPVLDAWTELAQLQLGRKVDCRPWLKDGAVATECFLAFNLIVDSDAGAREYRQGWARIDTIALRTTGLRLQPATGRRVSLRVRSTGGQTIPGALVLVDDVDVSDVDLSSQFVLTGPDGSVVVSGLETGRRYAARVVDGVGPDAREATATIDPDASSAELVCPLAGRWNFVKHRVALALPGSSVLVDKVEVLGSSGAAAWPVNRWIPPGLGRESALWIMCPESAPAGRVPARISFPRRRAVDVPDLRTPTTLDLYSSKDDVKVVQDAPAAGAKSR